MKIVVLVKQVPDTEEERKLDLSTGMLGREANEAVADEINERALEVALRHKDGDKRSEIVVMSMGPKDATKALRKALSMGADSAIHVVDDSLAGADIATTAEVLAAAAQTEFDLLVAGNESTDGRGGVVPSMIAEHLGVPLLPSLDSVEISGDSVSGQVSVEGASLTLRSEYPAIISVTERAAEARFPNFKGIMTAKRKPLTTLSVADLGVVVGDGASSIVLQTAERPARAAGRKIVDDGSAASELAEFLVAGRLI